MLHYVCLCTLEGIWPSAVFFMAPAHQLGVFFSEKNTQAYSIRYISHNRVGRNNTNIYRQRCI